MLKLGTRPRRFISGNICFKILVQCICSAEKSIAGELQAVKSTQPLGMFDFRSFQIKLMKDKGQNLIFQGLDHSAVA